MWYTHTDEQIKKMWYIYTMEYYSAIKKNEIPFAAMWMDLEVIIPNEVSQRKTAITCYHLYVESGKKKIQMNLFTKQKQTYGHRKQIYGYQRGREGGINQESGINRYTLAVYIQQGPTVQYRETVFNIL